MSSTICKYRIIYDGNDGFTYEDDIYCKYEGVWDGQLWVDEYGTPVNFGCLTDSHAEVMAMCIAGIPTKDKFFYWEEVREFEIPKAVANAFNYEYPQKINHN